MLWWNYVDLFDEDCNDHEKCTLHKCTYRLTKLGLTQKKTVAYVILKCTGTTINLKKKKTWQWE